MELWGQACSACPDTKRVVSLEILSFMGGQRAFFMHSQLREKLVVALTKCLASSLSFWK